MTFFPLCQRLKTELAELAVFPDKYSRAELAAKLRHLASRVAADRFRPSANTKLFLKIELLYFAMLGGRYENPIDLAAALKILSSAADDQVKELYQSSLRIDP
ncbi:MAG: hypothetical protein HWQ41_19285 [Nostoc sp. NOS(2021)]|uniref:hypothetical protein n=1 Tax=Nostoc sp. NOS(2021) TaxID=2815407 RepID=UPI0025E9365F|nr:hypothetical protein [Nostoc sp. NOS(2021)]MBN3897339.1 hypothetical protein [Nostoc sp. NOS(2021)]